MKMFHWLRRHSYQSSKNPSITGGRKISAQNLEQEELLPLAIGTLGIGIVGVGSQDNEENDDKEMNRSEVALTNLQINVTYPPCQIKADVHVKELQSRNFLADLVFKLNRKKHIFIALHVNNNVTYKLNKEEEHVGALVELLCCKRSSSGGLLKKLVGWKEAKLKENREKRIPKKKFHEKIIIDPNTLDCFIDASYAGREAAEITCAQAHRHRNMDFYNELESGKGYRIMTESDYVVLEW